MLFSASSDGSVFIFRISEDKVNETQVSVPAIEDQANDMPHLMDPDLINIVLVRQKEMDEWLLKQTKLKQDLELTRQKVETKLVECKLSYKNQLEEIGRQKELDIQDLQKRFKDLSWQKELQEKQNKQATKKLEHYHYEEVKELEDLYSKKLA